MLESGEKLDYTRSESNCNMTYKFPESNREYAAICMRLSGTEILFKTDQNVELGHAVEIRILPENYACPSITAFVEIIQSNPVEKNHYEIAASIKGIKAR
ncbi:MAG: PilZ domain-containing protein [Methylococcaceae bacterium]|nr:PilZ domain-containing protein [Methylococcaceae bacterium]